jgi:hypothetical protein
MKLAAFLWLPLLCAGAERPQDLVSLVDAARGVPAEFAADALLRIAAVDRKDVDKAWRIELVDEAFRYAANAHDPYNLRPYQVKSQGPGGFVERVSRQELDGLTLQSRAVEQMLALDVVKARELFDRIPAPQLPRLACADSIVPDVSRYYAAMGRVANEAFSAKEIANEEPFKLLMSHTVVASAAQVGPVAHVIAISRLRDAQFRALLAQFLAGLKTVGGDDRTFTFWRRAGRDVGDLLEAAAKRNLPPTALLEGYRAYLVRHLSGTRCSDSMQMGVKVVIESIAYQIEREEAPNNPAGFFNDTLRNPSIPAITTTEETPTTIDVEAAGLKGCVSPECEAIGKKYRSLVIKPDSFPYTPAEKLEAEWQNRLREYLSAVLDWKQDTGANDAEHFRFKCSIYNDLLASVPPGDTRDLVLRASLTYLEQARNTVPRPAEWFLPANILISRVTMDPLAMGAFAKELLASADPVIALYTRLDKLAPRMPDRVMMLM